MESVAFKDLANTILGLKSKYADKIICIDGGGGAGKSTFAEHLKAHIPNAFVIHGDDLYIGPWDKRLKHTNYEVNPLGDYERFEKEVIQSVKNGNQVTYHIYNWHTHSLEENPVSIPPNAIISVEGLYMLQDRFSDIYDYSIWIEVDVEKRLERAMLRDGEHMRNLWEEDWLPVEKNYREKQNPMQRADLIVDGGKSDFSSDSFVVL